MKHTTTILRALTGLLLTLAAACLAPQAQAAVPGISGPNFALTASEGYNSQPDGNLVYAWGFGCTTAPTGFVPAGIGQGPAANCPLMQMPGPTLVVTEGQTVQVTLTNRLPLAAGNTSLVFPGLDVRSSGGVAGRYTSEAANGGGTVVYSFTASKPGTYGYHSGSQSDLQIEMGLFGAIVVLPSTVDAACSKGVGPYSGAANAYDNPNTCYDREYLFQFSEMNSVIHEQVKAQVDACVQAPCAPLVASMEPYHPNYFLINGRSMPDIMDTSYADSYPSQPYNGNPHMHPGEMVLMRVLGQGRWQHPFHFHGNHARLLARDANLLLSSNSNGTPSTTLAGPLLFTYPTVPGQTADLIFTWTGKGLNWDVYNHHAGDGSTCTPDANGYHAVASDPNYGEWCADHNKPIPVTPPDPTIVAVGQWYGGTPYLGLQSAASGFSPTVEAPGTLNQNPEAGYAYMWHSHNEREITTNDVFPGGMLMMLLIDPPSWTIDETQ
jgi:FtsP/CotA-like multicopper oxidase with cupredoxin domain